MRQMFLVGLLTTSAAAMSAAADNGPAPGNEVRRDEVLRLGDFVQQIDSSAATSGIADEIVMAMAPPEADDDKWFISVVKIKNCAMCQKLERDWQTDPWLKALAIPGRPNESWAHFNAYYFDDESQQHRWKNITFSAFPTVIVQPPRNGRYGSPGTCVYQATYRGDPRQLADNIGKAIRLYVGYKTQQQQAAAGVAMAKAPVDNTAASKAPPFDPPPKQEAPADRWRFPPGPNDVYVPPRRILEPEIKFTIPWGTILGGAGLASLPGILALILIVLRQWRKSTGRDPLLDDETFQRLIDYLRREKSSTTKSRRT